MINEPDVALRAYRQWCLTSTGRPSRELEHHEWATARREFLEVTGLKNVADNVMHRLNSSTQLMLQNMAGPHGHTYCKMLLARMEQA